MKSSNIILYIGLLSIILGIILYLFINSLSQSYYSGKLIGWGLIIAFAGFFFFKSKKTSNIISR